MVPLALGGLALFLALGLALWSWGSGRRVETGSPLPEARPLVSEAAEAELSPARAVPDAAAQRPRRTPETARLDPSTAATGGLPAIEPPPADGVEIRVVTGESKRSVAGAVVHFLDERAIVDEDMMELRAGRTSMDELLTMVGRRFRSDENGILVVPHPKRFGFVAGGTEDLWGMLEFQEYTTDDLELVLQPDPPLRVRVVDGSGAPVGGVPVAYRQRFQSSFKNDLFAVDSDPETGVATLAHMRRFIEQNTGQGIPHAALAVILAAPVEREIDPESFPVEPLELVLPPTGSVEVRIVGADGRPFEEQVFVKLVRTPDDEDENRAFSRGDFANEMTSDGFALFAHVGLGLDLSIQVSPTEGLAPFTTRHAGPRREGERVTIPVTLSRELPVLSGRALGPDGEPLPGARLDAWFRNVGGFGGEQRRRRTDEEGRFELSVRKEDAGTATMLELRTEDEEGVFLSASVPVSGRLVPGVNALGDVRFRPAPLIASGIVVDPSGRRVPGAKVQLELPRKSPRSERVFWQPDWETQVRSDAEGAFSIRGEIEAEQIGVSASHPDYVPAERLETVPGVQGLELVLYDAGRITGRVLLDAGVSIHALQLKVQNETTGELAGFGGLEEDGAFAFQGLLPGSYSLSVALEDEPGCGVTVDGVPVRAGETTEDPRLQELDLRGRIQSFTVEISTGSGIRPASNGMIRRRVPGREDYETNQVWIRDGRALIATCHPYLDLMVDVPGFRPVELEAVAEDVALTLQPGPRLLLRLGNTPRLPEDAYLIAQLRKAEPGSWRPTSRGYFDELGEVEVQVREPGPYEVFLVLAVRREGNRRTTTVSSGPETRIDVLDGTEVQAFDFQVSAETLRRIE